MTNRAPGATADWRAGTQEYLFSVTGRVTDHGELTERIVSTSVEAV